jgi:uncharacterized membrane protein YeaQ/YmgE (transglycosylase-associated protein family)
MPFLLNIIIGGAVGILIAYLINPYHLKINLERIIVSVVTGFVGAILGQIIPKIQNIGFGENLLNTGVNLIPSLVGAIILSLLSNYALNVSSKASNI